MSIRRVGARSLFLAAPMLLAAHAVVSLAWREPAFDWTVHNISDLGNVTCGRWDDSRPREVCSPWHPAMNAGLVATGVLLVLGTLFTWTALGRGAATRVTQVLTTTAGAGYVLAGAFPADVDEEWHFLGAVLIFVGGNAAMLVAAASRRSGLASARG